MHRAAKLPQMQSAPPPTVRFFHQKDWTRAGEFDRKCNQKEQRSRYDQDSCGENNVENPLDGFGEQLGLVPGHKLEKDSCPAAELLVVNETVEIAEAHNTNPGSFSDGNCALGHVVAGTRRRSNDDLVDRVMKKVTRKIVNATQKPPRNIRRHGAGVAIIHKTEQAFVASMLNSQFPPGPRCPAAAAYNDDAGRIARFSPQVRKKGARHLVTERGNEERNQNLRNGAKGMTGLKVKGKQGGHHGGSRGRHESGAENLARSTIETQDLHALLPKNSENNGEREIQESD